MASSSSTSLLKGLFAASLYGFISISITFFNKAVLASYNFQYPNIMTLFQMLCSLLLLEIMRLSGKIHYSTFNLQTAKKTFPLALSFVGMVLTGLAALKYLNIPMFNALRRITTLFTMIGEYYLVGTNESVPVQISVYAMVFGAIIAGFSDLEFTTIGYTLVALNCFFTAAYLLYIAKFGKQGLNTWGLMYYNNILSLPFVLLICIVNHDIQDVRKYPLINDMGFIVCFLFQSALAFLLNYSIFLCTNVNSALATSVTGQIKNIATTAVGFVTFQTERTRYSPLNVFGIVLGVWASSYYSWLKYKESEHKQKQPALPTTQRADDHRDTDMTMDTDREKNRLLIGVTSGENAIGNPVDDVDNDSNEKGRLLPRQPTGTANMNIHPPHQPPLSAGNSSRNIAMTSVPNYRPQIIDNIGSMTAPNAYINSTPIRPSTAGYTPPSTTTFVTSSGRNSPLSQASQRRLTPHSSAEAAPYYPTSLPQQQYPTILPSQTHTHTAESLR